MNDKLLQQAGVRFLPWEGRNYRQGLPDGKRLLVLGDSHYFSKCDQVGDVNRTRELVKDCIAGRGYGFFNRIHELLEGVFEGLCSKSEGKCWTYNSIAFYNYVTSDLLTHGSGGQTSRMYKDSEPAMIVVLRELNPTHVLILGRKLWGYFLYYTCKDKQYESLNGQERLPEWNDDTNLDKLWSFSLDDGNFLAANIYHPSARGNYSFSAQKTLSKRITSNFLKEKSV